MPTLSGLLARWGLSAFPFERALGALLVAAPSTVAVLSRPLREAIGSVVVANGVDDASRELDGQESQVVLLDISLEGAWEWLRTGRCGTVVVLVEDESVGMKALSQGAAAVVNIRTARAPELAGVIRRLLRSASASPGASPCAAMAHDAALSTGRVLLSVERAARLYSHAR